MARRPAPLSPGSGAIGHAGADAIKRAIEEFNVYDPEQQKRLVARRAG